jgi:TonB-linked SusC/RagA family outer membrane protein
MGTNLLTKILTTFLFTVAWTIAMAQEVAITGKVLDGEFGEPLPGVNIEVKGKGSGTLTDLEGNFSIKAMPSDLLVFSFIGFATQEIPVGDKRVINITLYPEATKLAEIVVVGYGTQTRANVTSSISKLDKEVLASAPRSNVGTALQGSIAGLRVINNSGTPGAAPSILLRGGASINNPGAPLVIVDGIIRALNDISPDDIESIEVLKDAAATAIYGARANNGVILITTKQAKAGTAQVSYKYVYGYNENREDYEYLNARDFIYYSRLGHLNSQRTLAQTNSQRGFGIPANAADRASFDLRVFDATTAPLLQMGWDTVPDPYGGHIIFRDHAGEVADLIFRNTNTNDHFLNISGGNDRGKYYASFNYYGEDGIIVGSDYKRYTANLNGSYKIRPNLEVNTGATLSTSSQFGVIAGEVNTLYRNLSIWPTFNPWLDSLKTLPNPGNGVADGNPLYWLDKTSRNNEVNRITGLAGVKYDIAKGLYLKATGNIYLFENSNESFTKATQTYAQIFSSPQVFNTTRPATFSFDRTVQTQLNAFLNYSTTIGGKHNLDAMIGAESFDQKFLSSQVSGTGAPTDDIPTVNASTIFAPGSNFSSKSEYRIISNFGRINYNFDRRFLLSLVHRYDGVSSLASANRWGFFPGMSAGWNLHNESFFSSSGLADVISTFKPRVSYGVNGNVAGIGFYEVQGSYGAQGNYNGALGFLNTGVINSDLRWEKSKTLDFGLDLGILQDRITFIFDYFDRRTSDLLTNLTLPSYTGFGSIRTNLGTFQNKGLEFAATADIVRSAGGFSWQIGGNVTYNTNKILELPFNGNENNRQGGFQIYDPSVGKVIWVAGLQEGRPLGEVYAFKQLSVFQNTDEVLKMAGRRYDAIANISGPELTSGAGKITPGDVNFLDVDKNDTIDTRDQVFVGNINPKFYGGFSSTMTYKNFRLFARFDFATGHILYNDLVARILGNYQGTFNNLDLIKRGFSGDNSRPDIMKIYWADQVGAPNGKKNITRANNANQVLQSNNSNYYEKGDYIGCREITLTYNFDPGLISKTGVFSNLTMYLNANNLFYITKFSGNSPEPKGNGIFAGNYPTPRTFVLGIQTTFK